MCLFFIKKQLIYRFSYNLEEWSKDLDTDFALGHFLFRAVELTKTVDQDKYEYSGYRIGFDSYSRFSWADGNNLENVIVFRVDNNCFVYINDGNKNILVLGEGSKKAQKVLQ